MDNKNLFSKPEVRVQNLNQGVYDSKFYYGRVVRERNQFTDAVIFSNGVCLVDYSRIKEGKDPMGPNQIEEYGMTYRNGLIEIGTHWSNESISKFVNGNAPTISPEELYRELRSIFSKYMDVHDERILSVAATYVLGTYCYALFNAYGYLFFNSEKESGKTKFMKLMELTSFNTVNATNPSEAALFRICEYMRPTLLVDDYEKIEDEKQKVINQLLKVGYKRGGQTVRTEKMGERYQPIIFDVYGPKIISNTTELDPIMLTRCVVVRLLKTKTDKGRLEPDENNAMWQELRDKCYVFVMQNWQKIQEAYQSYASTRFNNRNLELVKGVLSIAKVVGDETHAEIEDFLESSFTDRDIQNSQNDWEFILFQRIYENIRADDWYPVSVVSEWCAMDILPEKKDSRVHTVFTILTHEKGLKLIELMNYLRKRYGKEVSFQAVRKAVLQLIEEGVVVRDGNTYSINKQWVKDAKQAIDALYDEVYAEKVVPKKMDSIQGDVSVFTFSSLNEMMKFWQNLIHDWFRKFKKGDYNINCYQAAHVWEALLHLEKEKEVMGQLKKKGIRSYILSTSRSPLDLSIRRFYHDVGVKMEIALSTSHFDRGHYLGTYGDLIIQAQYPDELVKALDAFFKRNKTINAIDLTKLSNIVNQKHSIRLTVIRNLEMAKQINRHTLSQMDLS